MKKAAKTILFMIFMLGITIMLNHLTLNRRSEGCIQLADFYSLEKNQPDVLCIGSSHVYYGFNTCLMYDDYGIASFLLASPGQPVWISYGLLEEALKTQSPKLVVFDIGTLFQKGDDFGSSSWETLISMRPSLTKWNILKAVNRDGDFLDMARAFFSFPYYHERVLSLTEEDYRNINRTRYHGYRPEFTSISENELAKWEGKAKPVSEKVLPVSERTEEYLRKMMDLCREKEIALLFVNSPFANQTEEKRETGNYVRNLAGEYDIPVLEGNDLTDEMQIVFEEDLLDASHLNYYGSVKYTDYLAKWIKENYSIPDRREDERYWEWEKASEQFWHLEMKERILKETDTREEYLQILEDQAGWDVVVCWKQNGEADVYEDGVCIFSKTAEQDYERYFGLDELDLLVRCTDGKTQVWMDSVEYSFVEDGVNVLVYDKMAGRVIDGAGFAEGGGRVERGEG